MKRVTAERATVLRADRLLLILVGIAVAGGIAGCGLLTGGLAPEAPTDLVVTMGAFADRVRLTWNPVAEAGGYEVWRASTSDGTYAYLGPTAHAAYDDMTANPETTYWYKVRACNRAGCSEFTAPRAGKAVSNLVPAVPNGVAASQGTFTDRVTVTWQAATRATSYSLYRAAAEDGPYTLIAVLDTTSYDDVGIVLGTTYWYKVRACSGLGCSVLSVAASGYASSQVPAVPQDVTVEEDEAVPGALVVTWEASAGATTYMVYRALAEDDAPNLVATVTEAAYVDITVEAGPTYWYWVRACSDFGCSPLSDPASGSLGEGGETPPPTPSSGTGGNAEPPSPPQPTTSL